MTPRFTISHWATWPDPLDSRGLTADAVLSDSPLPGLPAMPAMLRRRVERLGRLALHVAYASLADDEPTSLVFASRWGDVEKSIDLIGQLGIGQLSPMGFSLSVHNAIAAQFSIARGDTQPYTAIAAGEGTIEAAFIEALGQLADGVAAVTVVYYDEPLPMPYRRYSSKAEFARAWACRLRLTDSGGFSLAATTAATTTDHDDTEAAGNHLPGDLAVFEFLRSDRARLRRRLGAGTWCWQRHE